MNAYIKNFFAEIVYS